MNETTSSSRAGQSLPVSGNPGSSRPETPPPDGHPLAPAMSDQRTIISTGSPMVPASLSDSAYRILQGKILPGDRLGHFELTEYVGGGGMGRVFRAVDTRLERTVALKVLPPDQAADQPTLLRFRNEAQSAARLDHENIARVHYVGEDRGIHFIVFEFVEGVNIRDLVEQNGPLSLAKAVSYTLQIARALAHAAGREVVHRDIKPSNVLITPQRHVKVIDMGLARLQRENAPAVDLTASGVTLGTFDYISPEQARDPRNADVRSDIYSLGCTFFYMLAGRPPFPEGTVLQKLLQHQGDQPPDVRQFRPELPDEAARVLRKMLAKDPRHRYLEPAELVEDLLGLAKQVGLEPSGPGGRILVVPRERVFSFFRRHLPWIAPIAALICIVVLLDVVWSSLAEQGGRPQQPLPLGLKVPAESADPGDSRPTGGPVAKPRAAPGEVPDRPAKTNGSDKPAPPEGPSDGPGDTTAAEQRAALPEAPVAEEPTVPTGSGPLDRLVVEDSHAGRLRPDSLAGGVSVAERTSEQLSVASASKFVPGHLSGATPAASEPNEAAATVEPAAKRTGLLVVNQIAKGEGEFLALSAACDAATNGDVIELRYNGRREERPIKLANLKVTIRAGEGYRPVVVFRPTEMDGLKHRRSMFTVASGRLTFLNLALELDVPRKVPAESWSLFETRGGPTVRLEKCSLTIRNASDQLAAYHQVAFFRTRSATDAGGANGDGRPAATPPTTIDLLDCIARGEAVFLEAVGCQPVHLAWENGLLATTERLLSATGCQRAPPSGEMLQVDLRHMTAVVRGGLCRMTNTQLNPHQLTTQVRCTDSILAGGPGASLIEQEGVAGDEEFRQHFVWNGERNFYEDFDAFWTIRNIDRKTKPEPMGFAAWQTHWGSEEEILPLCDEVVWKKLPEADRPLHTHTPADYALGDAGDATSNNSAIGAASDGYDAGFQSERLPALPSLPSGPPAREPDPANTP